MGTPAPALRHRSSRAAAAQSNAVGQRAPDAMGILAPRSAACSMVPAVFERGVAQMGDPWWNAQEGAAHAIAEATTEYAERMGAESIGTGEQEETKGEAAPASNTRHSTSWVDSIV